MNLAQHPLFVSLTPVFLLIALGYLAGRREWIRDSAVKDLSNLVFLLLIPALLFRTMASVHLEVLDLRPVLAYFPVVVLVLFAIVAWRGFSRESVVIAMASVFSNMVMIGITLAELAYGKSALVTMLTLVSVHALILLSVGSVVLELVVAREARERGEAAPPLWATLGSVIKGTLIHPIPLPILSGLLFAQSGWSLPVVIDKPLQLLGSAFGPIALVLVGVSLARTPLAGHWRPAFGVVLVKNLLLPLLVGLSAWGLGITGLPLTVMVVAAALPVGANVFLFAQRYDTAQALTIAATGLTTVMALFTLSLVMTAMAWLNPLGG
ncbi:MAG: AEC family transporter [Hydrogenophaga sp.]|uniref:AEC family transporter n=1 Tax=Hydrogenophaga sp. TaxID=1904254 RepID=UPI0016AFC592|nr:AEC family transporter [Hydrogenophaga sp.]NIM41803.1 AEC family transporter [Hydrogenophaga sp.]NIN27108.1 AEC family transporter [Hydrogenophaga sp.]NIN31809.1 AEC family transporter [Hydrogenophaga sp.]NIN56053.1 AEC family transporter [Hydrogenophaga sp.]NIO52180.1 AEC family transporter [Hydrogenophaga sp.]